MARSKTKTLRSHRNKVPAKREKKKKKQTVIDHNTVINVKREQKESEPLTLEGIKEMFPKMHLRDALRKISELRHPGV